MTRQRAFSLIELLVVIAIIALLVSILLPALAGARKEARKVVCMANMQQFGRGFHAYAADHKGRIASLSGERERQMTAATGGWGTVPTHLTACSLEAQILIRTYGGRSGFPAFDCGPSQAIHLSNTVLTANLWEQLNHLALVEYMGAKLPMLDAVCPEDQPRLHWRKNPLNIAASSFQPVKSINRKNREWFPYGSSYQIVPALIMPDDGGFTDSLSTNVATASFLMQADYHDTYMLFGEKPFGRRKMEEVTFPSQKVALMDSQARHFAKREQFYAYENSQQPLLFVDGSVSNRPNNSEKGWRWTCSYEGSMVYEPDTGFESPKLYLSDNDHPDLHGIKDPPLNYYYRWTRNAIKGFDYR